MFLWHVSILNTASLLWIMPILDSITAHPCFPDKHAAPILWLFSYSRKDMNMVIHLVQGQSLYVVQLLALYQPIRKNSNVKTQVQSKAPVKCFPLKTTVQFQYSPYFRFPIKPKSVPGGLDTFWEAVFCLPPSRDEKEWPLGVKLAGNLIRSLSFQLG